MDPKDQNTIQAEILQKFIFSALKLVSTTVYTKFDKMTACSCAPQLATHDILCLKPFHIGVPDLSSHTH